MSKDKRPGDSEFFSGNSINRGAYMPCEANNSITAEKNNYPTGDNFNSGNKCEHNPLSPRFPTLPAHHNRRPLPITIAINGAEDYYWRPKYSLKALQKHRQARSEGREATAVLIQTILHFTDLDTMAVAVPTPSGEMLPLTLEYLANLAGVSLRRAYRAMTRFVEAGYLTVTRRCEKTETGGFRGLAAIRRVSALLFVELGVEFQLLSLTRSWRHKRADMRLTGLTRAIRKAFCRPRQNGTHQPSIRTKQQEIARKQAQAARMLELLQRGVPSAEARRIVFGMPP